MTFKAVEGRQCRYQSKAHMRLPISDFDSASALQTAVIAMANSSVCLTSYLAPFPCYGWLLVKFSLVTGEHFTSTPSLEVIPCEYPEKIYICRNYSHFAT